MSIAIQTPVVPQVGLPNAATLHDHFVAKYGDPERVGWIMRRWYRHGYHLPADVYECVVAGYVTPGCRWLDVGGGDSMFPHNPKLARALAARCSHVVGVDPSPNIHQNELVHERHQCLIEDYATSESFDVATLRMVVEHVQEPTKVVQSLARLLTSGGVAIIFTVNGRAPVTLVSRLTPFGLHHPIKRLLWGGEEKDTFPVVYKMNTRHRLAALFGEAGFQEESFAHLDDLSSFARISTLNHAELTTWRMLRRVGLNYPENCLLAVYRRLS